MFQILVQTTHNKSNDFTLCSSSGARSCTSFFLRQRHLRKEILLSTKPSALTGNKFVREVTGFCFPPFSSIQSGSRVSDRPEMIAKVDQVFHNPNTATAAAPYVNLKAFRTAVAEGKVKDVAKFTHEIFLMQQSASVACQSLIQTMLYSMKHKHESSLAAKVKFECKIRDAQRMAFNPVVGGGANASTIHYARNDKTISEGELVMMDTGCELHGYLSDLTRTWPISGHFKPYQEELYSLILETNKECVKLCKPGASIREITQLFD